MSSHSPFLTLYSAFIGALLLWGCPSEDSQLDDGPVTTYAAASAKMNRLAIQFCRYQLNCGGELQHKGLDQARCVEIFDYLFKRDKIHVAMRGIEEGTVTFNEQGYQCGINALSQAASSCEDINDINCANPFTGTLEEGATCLTDDECALGLECSIDGEVCASGTCQVATPLRCYTDQDCEAVNGATCRVILSVLGGKLCEIPVAEEGESCDLLDCSAGLSCAFDDDTGARQCAPGRSAALGEACDWDRITCDVDARCSFDPMSETRFSCQAPVALGDPCTVSIDSISGSNCVPNSYCLGINLNQNEFEGVCTLEPQEGEACGPGEARAGAQNDEGYCPIPFECLNDTCVLLKRYGQSCASNEECVMGVCEGGVCGALMCSEL